MQLDAEPNVHNIRCSGLGCEKTIYQYVFGWQEMTYVYKADEQIWCYDIPSTGQKSLSLKERQSSSGFCCLLTVDADKMPTHWLLLDLSLLNDMLSLLIKLSSASPLSVYHKGCTPQSSTCGNSVQIYVIGSLLTLRTNLLKLGRNSASLCRKDFHVETFLHLICILT